MFIIKLLYAIITILSNKEGYCFASNAYLSNLLDARPHTISKWVSHLRECGFVCLDMIKNEKGEIIQRRIYPNDTPYGEREKIDLDKITLNKLKSIIKDCGWNVINKNGIWRIERTTMYGKDFAFEVDISDNSVSNVVKEIQRYYSSFNKDEYVL